MIAATFLMMALTLTACTRVSTTDQISAAPTCSELLAAAVQYERSSTGDINAIMDALSDGCSDSYEIATDYLMHSTDSEFRVDSCDELAEYRVREEAIALLAQDGKCSFAPSRPAADAWPNGGLGWDDARDHVGTVQRVCGPLISARETDDGTFLNLGRDYPSSARFTIIFWDTYLEPITTSATLCGTGEIYLYEGVTQMEMTNPRDLEIWQ